MIYPHNFEEKIGFSRVRQLVKSHCLSVLGVEKVDSLQFQTDYDEILPLLNQTQEFRKIILEGLEFPTENYFDTRTALNKIKIEGSYMTVAELFELKRSLETIKSILQFFKKQSAEAFPALKQLTDDVAFFPYIVERIDGILTRNGEMRTNASKDLQTIVNDIHSKEASVSKLIHSILKKAQAAGYVDTETTLNVRDGKMLIPVAATHKRQIKGIIVDESATGKTVFIEPFEVTELNNQVRELEFAKQREIIKILTTVTNDIRPYREELVDLYDLLGLFDFIRAKALFALSVRAQMPDRTTHESISEWYQATHPLLYLQFQKDKKDVIPLELTMNHHDRIILISGPNAGGKSVCLKTVGLLQYMFQCGMLVTALNTSTFGVYRNIFIDIGDEQSLENDLSTYSSHLKNMKYFMEFSNENTLILIDEFGTGTEPLLGGAIAESVLEKLNENRARGVITTHYTSLKHFATSAEGIINGAMLFDNHRMQPLFKLQIGEPGSSFAFEIARKMGLPNEVLQKASDKIGKEHIDFDKNLKDIQRDRRYWEEKRKKIRQVEKRLEDLELKYNEELQKTSSKRKEIIEEAKLEAKTLLDNSNKLIEKTIHDIKVNQAEKEKTKEARNKLEEFKKNFEEQLQKIENEKIERKIEKLKNKDIEKQSQQLRRPVHKEPQQRKEVEKSIEAGDVVRIKGQENTGEVLSINNDKAEVSFGLMRSFIELSRLEKLSKNEAKKQDKPQKTRLTREMMDEITFKKLYFKPDLDVRGKRMEEALQLVEKLVDEAVVCDVRELRILHGTGYGILRQSIREYLKIQPIVKSCRDEILELGGAGITLVQLDF